MKKSIIGVILSAAIVGVFYSIGSSDIVKKAVEVLKTDSSKEILHPGAALKSYDYFSSTDEAVVCSGRCALYDVITASGADGSYVVIRDTATADGSGSSIMSKLEFDGTGIAKSLAAGNPNAFPIVTTYGISVDLSSVGSNEQILVIYKDLD